MKILQLSGGKDSLACLVLYKEELKDIIVMWANSGDAFPETIKQMEFIRELCPNFIEVKGRQPEIIEKYGYPVDVLPLRNQHGYQLTLCQNRPKLQGFFECCFNSYLNIMHEKCKELGATEIIRGQKLCDSQKSPIRNGMIIDGIKYTMPLENWTDSQVISFLNKEAILPYHYVHTNAMTGLDCMYCTAHIYENKWKLKYLEDKHPVVGKEVRRRLELIQKEVKSDMQHLDEVLGG